MRKHTKVEIFNSQLSIIKMDATKNIRNFSIIAHIDHGKSTLADRLLELTKTVEVRQMHSQYLDMMDLEQERGITIKMQPVRMEYNGYILNLIDTPGHVDFSYEVSRSLAAVEGVILLVDGTKGIQAQTLAHLGQAQKQNKVIIAAVNKIDLPNARPEEIEEELKNLLGEDVEIFKISAKDGTNVDKLLDTVIEKVPSPKNSLSILDRALIFDSTYDSYKGVLAYVRVFNGSFKGGQKIKLIAQNKEAEIMEVGHFKPQLSVQKEIKEGEMGFIATGLKDPSLIRVGDTAVILNSESQFLDLKNYALEGYKDPHRKV